MKIVFAHNVHMRVNTLKKTIDLERKYFPDAQFVIGCNYVNSISSLLLIENINWHYYTPDTHKAGCLNGFILTIKEAMSLGDVIIFSHDDVQIDETNIPVIVNNIEKLSAYDLICRKPIEMVNMDYSMMECVYLTKNGASELLKNFEMVSDDGMVARDSGGSISPEAHFAKQINATLKPEKVLQYTYDHLNTKQYNEILGGDLGYVHLNAGLRGWTD